MPATMEFWTADDLDRLPEDDGNKYEVVDGRLLVTPAPSLTHEVVLLELARLLRAYADTHAIGQVFHRNDLKFDAKNRVDPDLSVVKVPIPVGDLTWRTAPRPLLIVEVLSRSTRTHDLVWKAALYAREWIPLSWIVDHRERIVYVVREGGRPEVVTGMLTWHPEGTPEPFELDVAAFFTAVLGKTDSR